MWNLKKFPVMSKSQIDKFLLFEKLFKNWNNKVNLISRKDIDFLFERHICYSLAITFFSNLNLKQKYWMLELVGVSQVYLLLYFSPNVEFHIN